MQNTTNKLLMTAMLLGLSGACVAQADSTAINMPPVNTVGQPYLLAQSTIVSAGDTDKPTTNLRCSDSFQPVLRTSVAKTYLNEVAAISGIENNLQLRQRDYHIVGSLYMSNHGAIILGNSEVTANWQIWCQPIVRA